MRGWRVLACVALLALLAACGFRLKGATPLPFDTLYTNISDNTAFGAHLLRSIRAASPQLRLVSDPAQAQARLTQIDMQQWLRDVAISAEGQVEEYELNLRFVFQLTDARGHLLLPPTTLEATRDVPYDPSALQAKQGEIGSLFVEMQRSLVDRIVRRLTAPEVIQAYENADNLPIDTQPVEPGPTVRPQAPPSPDRPASMTPGLFPG